MQEAYFRYMAENPTAGLTLEEEDENVDYDSDGNPINPTKKIILPLPPIDHSEVRSLRGCISLSRNTDFRDLNVFMRWKKYVLQRRQSR